MVHCLPLRRRVKLIHSWASPVSNFNNGVIVIPLAEVYTASERKIDRMEVFFPPADNASKIPSLERSDPIEINAIDIDPHFCYNEFAILIFTGSFLPLLSSLSPLAPDTD
jgi:hypothetical protein